MIREYDENGFLSRITYNTYSDLKSEKSNSVVINQEHDEHGRVVSFCSEDGIIIETCDYDEGYLHTEYNRTRYRSMHDKIRQRVVSDYYFEGDELINCVEQTTNVDAKTRMTREYWYEYDDQGRLSIITTDFGDTIIFGYDDTPIMFDGEYIPDAKRVISITISEMDSGDIQRVTECNLIFPDGATLTYYWKASTNGETGNQTCCDFFERDNNTLVLRDKQTYEEIELQFDEKRRCTTPSKFMRYFYDDEKNTKREFYQTSYDHEEDTVKYFDEFGREVKSEKTVKMGMSAAFSGPNVKLKLKYYDDDLCSYADIDASGYYSRISEGYSTVIDGELSKIDFNHRINYAYEMSKVNHG